MIQLVFQLYQYLFFDNSRERNPFHCPYATNDSIKESFTNVFAPYLPLHITPRHIGHIGSERC